MWLWGGDKEMEGEINHLLQHKAQVISWKWTYTGVWYMVSPLPCNGNLSVLYDFIQNPSSLCGATKHIKAKWRMVPVSIRKAGGGYNIYSPPAGVGDGRFPINYSERNLPHCILFRSIGWALPWLHACACVCDGSSVPLWHASVVLNEADFNGCLNEMPGP